MPGAPPLPTMPPTLPSMIPTELISNQTVVIGDQNTLKEVKDILLFILEKSELGPKSNDIKRRISVMEDMWTSGKLNPRIHQQMKELAYGQYIKYSLLTVVANQAIGRFKDYISSGVSILALNLLFLKNRDIVTCINHQ